MKAIQKALDLLGRIPTETWATEVVKHEAQAVLMDAREEVQTVQTEVRKAMALHLYAIAGLRAFHGRLCSMAPGAYPENASECADPKCLAWAAALKEET